MSWMSTLAAASFLVLRSVTAGAESGREADLGEKRELVTDPKRLQEAGFAPDARNVYILKGALDPQMGLRLEAKRPEEFGGNTSFTPLSAKAFRGRMDTTGTLWSYSDPTGRFELTREGSENFAEAPLLLPDGAILDGMRWWVTDIDATNDMAFFIFSQCLPAAAGGLSVATQLIGANPGTAGATGPQTGFAAPPPISVPVVIDNVGCTYIVRVRFDNTGSSLVLQKIRVEWHRQVSPAPATATFTDVPVGAPQFRFVEALVAAGITAGCGSGNFCPDQAVTRGQMAVFLSVALGLHFP